MLSREPVTTIITSGENTLRIDPLTRELYARLTTWEKGFHVTEHEGKKRYVFIFQDGEGEVMGLRYHFGYFKDKDAAEEFMAASRMVLPDTLRQCTEYDFAGILIPCPYMAQLEDVIEAGYVLFVQSERDFTGPAEHESIESWDEAFGPGGSRMIIAFMQANSHTWKAVGVDQMPVADVHLAERSRCGALATDYMLVDSNLICMKQELHEEDPLLMQAAEVGFTQAYWMPSVFATLSK